MLFPYPLLKDGLNPHFKDEGTDDNEPIIKDLDYILKSIVFSRFSRKSKKLWGCDKMDVSQYLGIFIDETKEHLQSLNYIADLKKNLMYLSH